MRKVIIISLFLVILCVEDCVATIHPSLHLLTNTIHKYILMELFDKLQGLMCGAEEVLFSLWL